MTRHICKLRSFRSKSPGSKEPRSGLLRLRGRRRIRRAAAGGSFAHCTREVEWPGGWARPARLRLTKGRPSLGPNDEDRARVARRIDRLVSKLRNGAREVVSRGWGFQQCRKCTIVMHFGLKPTKTIVCEQMFQKISLCLFS